MKTISKRIAAFLLAVIMLTSGLMGCKKNVNTNENVETKQSEYVTRGEWVTWLSQTYGLEEYESEKPYYSDVNSDSEIFAYVQSCYEWEILSQGTKEFKPNVQATWGFVLSTAVLANGYDYSSYPGNTPKDKLINCAMNYELCAAQNVSKDNLTQPIDKVNAVLILNRAQELYLNAEFEEYENIVFNENVIDCRLDEIVITDPENGSCTVDSKVAENLQTGSVFIEPATAEYPAGRAVKVVDKIDNGDGTYSLITTEPELEEVFEEIELCQSSGITADMVVPEEGVKVTPLEDSDSASLTAYELPQVRASQLAYVKNDVEVKRLKSINSTATAGFCLEVDLRKGQSRVPSLTPEIKYENDLIDEFLISLSKPDEGFEIDKDKSEEFTKWLKDKGFAGAFLETDPTSKVQEYDQTMESLLKRYESGEISRKELKQKTAYLKNELLKNKSKLDMKKTTSYKAEYKITGTVDFRIGFLANVDAKIIPLKLNKFEFGVTGSISSKVNVEGEIGTEISLAKAFVPIGATGADIVLEIIGRVEANGKFTIGIKFSDTAKMTYEKGKWRYSNDTDVKTSAEIEAELFAGAGLKVTLRVWGLKIVNGDLLFGGKINAKGELSIDYDTTYDEDDIPQKTQLICTASLKLSSAPVVRVALGSDQKTVLGKLKISLQHDFEIDKFKNEKEFKIQNKFISYNYTNHTIREPQSGNETTSIDTNDILDYYDVDAYMVDIPVGGVLAVNTSSVNKYKDCKITYESKDPNVATVDSNGSIVALSEGSTVIKITAYNPTDGTTKEIGAVSVMVFKN